MVEVVCLYQKLIDKYQSNQYPKENQNQYPNKDQDQFLRKPIIQSSLESQSQKIQYQSTSFFQILRK